MDKAVSVGGEFRLSNEGGDPSDNPTSHLRASAVPQPLNLKVLSWYSYLCIVLIFPISHFGLMSVQAANFSVKSNSYDCLSNIICVEDAHVFNGKLSLLEEDNSTHLGGGVGVAYYNQRVRLLDPETQQWASFNTSFIIDTDWRQVESSGVQGGDGMVFVISANNTFTGDGGGAFGIFATNGETSFKSIVVEFDTFQNSWANRPSDGPPSADINDNHVSLDFASVAYAAVANASKINVELGANITKYVWVEYSAYTSLFEVRVSYNNSRPILPLLNNRVNLSDVVDEYMWVGFASGSGLNSSNYYIGDWTFESYGILTSSPAPNPTGSKPGSKNSIVYVSVAAALSLLACILITLVVRRFYRSWLLWWMAFREELVEPIEGMPERFTYKQLSRATKAFSEESKLGEGGFGNVYRGVLPMSGIPVAVKRISRNSKQGEKEFMAEVSIISRLRHRNLIQLFGWCKDAIKEEYLIVYELMPNGSLDKVLFGPADSQTACLSWPQRFSIVTGIASALDYLHQGWNQQVIHRDIKSSNVMLDEEWNAKLGDFGLARLVDHQQEVATTKPAGTYGYISPEVAAYGKPTDKSDIFAFGAVVLEVACGRRALSTEVPENEQILVDWVWQRLSEGDLLSTVDKRLEVYETNAMELLLMIGLLCSHPNPLCRPSMRQVAHVLAGDAPVPSIPASKPGFS